MDLEFCTVAHAGDKHREFFLLRSRPTTMHSGAPAFCLPWLEKYPVVVVQAVAWGDMDAYQHVNNVQYFRYFESARLEYFARMGWKVQERPAGVGPIVASTQARFRRSLTYPDTIAIGARLLLMEADRFTLEHRIVSQAQRDWVTEGQVLIVTYDYARNTKAAIPQDLVDAIHRLEGRS